MIAVSYSRINDFEVCPKKFWGKYISKSFPKDESNPHLIRGRNVHKTLERLMKMGAINVEGELAYLAPLINKLREGKQVFIEKQYAFDITGKPVDWFDKRVWLRVVYDVAVVNDKIAYLIDWKTGKVRDKNRDQLALFAATAFLLYPNVETIYSAYIWVDNPDAKPSIDIYYRHQAEDLLHSWKERSEVIQMANESGNWPATPSPLCNWCPARRDHCEHSKA